MTPYPKRLIEVDLPIKKISKHARREKSIRHGHISTLHIWWARRPLAACRAVICAALWPDPVDELCPQAFRDAAAQILADFAEKTRSDAKVAGLVKDHWTRWHRTNAATFLPADNFAMWPNMRETLLDFIADFANWDASTVPAFLETARALTQTAHESLGGLPDTRPLVVDPFAGGGAIPLEALRVGADAFASDLNPVAVLLNKVVLEYIPKYGKAEFRMMNDERQEIVLNGLAEAVRYWGNWIKEQAEKELAEFYPKDSDGATPIAYLWARTIICEGPGCGVEVPLIKSNLLDSKRADGKVYLNIKGDEKKGFVQTTVKYGDPSNVEVSATVRGWAVTCPICEYTTPKKQVQKQISQKRGGASASRLIAIVSSYPNRTGKKFRDPNQDDLEKTALAEETVKSDSFEPMLHSLTAKLPNKKSHRAVGSQLPLYGFEEYGDLYTARQRLVLSCLSSAIQKMPLEQSDLKTAIYDLMTICLAKQADYSTSLCRWRHDGAYVNPTLGGEKKYIMVSDFAESCPLSHGSGNWFGQIDWVSRVVKREASHLKFTGQVIRSSSDKQILPEELAAALVTDPPYYDSVPYSDLANFYYVWHKPLLHKSHPELFEELLTPKQEEMTVDHPNSEGEKEDYKRGLARAFEVGRQTIQHSGISVIVFAHKSTSGWEALLEAIVSAGWRIVASWPVDTELQNRLNALGTASLASSVHLVCRPRQDNTIGDWRDVLQELPQRIHEWLPRLAREGVVGADAIFACLGPALEIYSRYAAVEKASGEQVSLKEYLEYVWAAVSKEALGMGFQGADASGFEEDARLTAMWLWTLNTEAGEQGSKGAGELVKSSGYMLEYDAARKIAQGLGAHLEKLGHLVEVKGGKSRLLPVSERTRHLFGKEGVEATSRPVRKQSSQLSMFANDELGMMNDELGRLGDDFDSSFITHHSSFTTLDRVHQSMLLFAAGRSEALRRFLVEEGVGQDTHYWSLANALSALYPPATDEKRWVDGVLARKKGLGF